MTRENRSPIIKRSNCARGRSSNPASQPGKPQLMTFRATASNSATKHGFTTRLSTQAKSMPSATASVFIAKGTESKTYNRSMGKFSNKTQESATQSLNCQSTSPHACRGFAQFHEIALHHGVKNIRVSDRADDVPFHKHAIMCVKTLRIIDSEALDLVTHCHIRGCKVIGEDVLWEPPCRFRQCRLRTKTC